MIIHMSIIYAYVELNLKKNMYLPNNFIHRDQDLRQYDVFDVTTSKWGNNCI